MKRVGNSPNRPLAPSYFARRIWHGPGGTCWHVWLEAPPTHQFRKATGPTVTFVQLHGTGCQQIVRRVPSADRRWMSDRELGRLYLSPEPEQVVGLGVDAILRRLEA